MPPISESVPTWTQNSSSDIKRFLLRRLGFFIDPFQHQEASTDPHLGHYVVGLTQSQIARGEHPALLYAPAGGGKTAMRLHVLRSCWVGLAGDHPLPVSCIPTRKDMEQEGSNDSFWRFLGRSTATSLLLGLSYRPERFLALEYADAEHLISLWHALLPSPFARYWRILSEDLDPGSLVRRLDLAYQLPDTPDISQLDYFCHRLQLPVQSQSNTSAWELWATLKELILTRLNFGSIFLLLDGMDGFPSTFHQPKVAERWLQPFFDQLLPLEQEQVYVKAFLADEMRPLIEDDLPVPLSIPQTRLEWTPDLLAEMIRKRVEYASRGRLGSLDPYCGPGLRGVEAELVRHIPVPQWPRPLLRYTQSVLMEWSRRTRHAPGPIEEDDLRTASIQFGYS